MQRDQVQGHHDHGGLQSRSDLVDVLFTVAARQQFALQLVAQLDPEHIRADQLRIRDRTERVLRPSVR